MSRRCYYILIKPLSKCHFLPSLQLLGSATATEITHPEMRMGSPGSCLDFRRSWIIYVIWWGMRGPLDCQHGLKTNGLPRYRTELEIFKTKLEIKSFMQALSHSRERMFKSLSTILDSSGIHSSVLLKT